MCGAAGVKRGGEEVKSLAPSETLNEDERTRERERERREREGEEER